ncbi:YaaL family protein [Thermoclostridium stercorarium]|uniref:YaaL family protein n=1 Tax=Thermoclostridium stercorarium TaxID=1510 RepID=UPI002091F866|nr:YaaL family protein [Thermoclostridium stercorarium]
MYEGKSEPEPLGGKSPEIFRKLLHGGDEEFQTPIPENLLLLKSIQQARQEWIEAVQNFDQADNNELIDYFIYRMKACQIRYNYLLKVAKEMGLRGELYEAK